MQDQKPTVVLVVNTAWVAGKFRSRLMQSLRDSGFRVVLLTDNSEEYAPLGQVCDEVRHVRFAVKSINPLADLRTLFSCWRELRRLKPVAVLTFTIKPNVYASLAARVLGIPTISNVTGMGSMKGSGFVVSRIVQGLYRLAFARSRWVFFQNESDAADIARRGLVRPGCWSILPGSGVDLSRYVPQEKERQGTAVRFCMVARLLRDKGVGEYAQAARLLKAEGLDVEFDLWGILDSNDRRCVTLDEIRAWEAEGLLSFRGEAPDARAAFTDADVVVLPSYYPEGVPRTLLEAGSMALPSITTDTTGCRDAVVDAVTGLLCRPRDARSLAEAMRRLVDIGADGRRAVGNAARQRMIDHFDEAIVLRAYHSLLQRPDPPAMEPSVHLQSR